eukprot:9132761-Pyramimonas_sp.AAC.1
MGQALLAAGLHVSLWQAGSGCSRPEVKPPPPPPNAITTTRHLPMPPLMGPGERGGSLLGTPKDFLGAIVGRQG